MNLSGRELIFQAVGTEGARAESDGSLVKARVGSHTVQVSTNDVTVSIPAGCTGIRIDESRDGIMISFVGAASK